MANGEVLDVTLRVTGVLEQMHIPYLVGGSLASSLHGIPRATQDVDLVAHLSADDIQPLVQALQDEFYIDADMIRDAIRRQSSFNLIHLDTLFKVDVFIYRKDALNRQEMARGQRYFLGDEPERSVVIASPEDIILQKLYWYQLGEQVSERQWNDVLGVLKVRGNELDVEYMEHVARDTGLSQLLEEAFKALKSV